LCCGYGEPVSGKILKTVYPTSLSNEEVDVAAEKALADAAQKTSGSKYEPPGTKQKKDGAAADGYFESSVLAGDPSRSIRIQGWFKLSPSGARVISSHAPMFSDQWPALPKEEQ
jgi:hypothetical protein